MSLEILTAVIAAGETKTFHLSGQYIEIIDAQYPADYLMQDRNGGMVGLLKGAEVSFYSRPKLPFGTLQITSANAQTIRLFVGDGDAGTRRISSVVQIVDGNAARSKAGSGYLWRLTCGYTAGGAPSAQMFNPAGSGVRLIFDSVQASLDIAGAVVYGFFATPLATLDMAKVRNAISVGGAVTKGQARVDTNFPPLTPIDYLGASYVSAKGIASVDLKRPIVLMPGNGLLFFSDVINANMTGVVQFYEEAI